MNLISTSPPGGFSLCRRSIFVFLLFLSVHPSRPGDLFPPPRLAISLMSIISQRPSASTNNLQKRSNKEHTNTLKLIVLTQQPQLLKERTARRRRLIQLHLSKRQYSDLCMTFGEFWWLCVNMVCVWESQSVVHQYHNLQLNQLVFNGANTDQLMGGGGQWRGGSDRG